MTAHSIVTMPHRSHALTELAYNGRALVVVTEYAVGPCPDLPLRWSFGVLLGLS